MGGLIAVDAWEVLIAAAAPSGLVRTRVAPQAAIDVFVAVEKPSAARLLLFGLASQEQAASLDVPEATGIAVRAVPTAGEAGWGYAEVRLVDVRYLDVFGALAEDLVAHVAEAATGLNAITRLGDRLRRWEAFLKLVEPDWLGDERRAGLYGELHVMRAHLLPLGPEMTVNAWVGAEGAHQDFQAAGWALEVKTSRTKEPISVRIASERQLDDVGLGFLALAHVGLEQRRDSGETLPEIVASVRAMLANTTVADAFEAQLVNAGYFGGHASRYLRDGYVVRFDELFVIREGFPRITERDLRNGVGDVRYSVAVSAVADFSVPWTEFADWIPSNQR